jgi:hypothetical protein
MSAKPAAACRFTAANFEDFLSRLVPWAVAVALLLTLQSWLVLTHTAWLDEWQALQIAVQSPNIPALLQNLRYEGHPLLWYLILRGAASVVPPFLVLAVVQLPIALALQALILFRAPFTRLERLLIASSYFVLIEFGTLSRSLGLGALLTVAFFATRSRPVAWALVILLPMVDFQFGLLSIGAITLLVRDGKWSTSGALLWLTSSLLAAWSVLPAADMISHRPAPLSALASLTENLSSLLLPLRFKGGAITWDGSLPWHIGLILGPAFVLFALTQVEKVALHRWIFRGFLLACGLFSLFAYILSLRHLALIALLLILLKWREVERGGTLDAPFRAWLAVIAASGLIAAGVSAIRPFDNAPRVATWIEARGLRDKLWISWGGQGRGVPAGALLGREMMMLRKGCTHSFIRWNFRDNIEMEPDLDRALDEVATRYGRSYLITGADLSSMTGPKLRPLTIIPPGFDGVGYYLYVVRPDLPETDRRPPPCAPLRRPLLRPADGH